MRDWVNTADAVIIGAGIAGAFVAAELSEELQEEQMSEVFIIGVELAKSVFEIYGADVSGEAISRKS